MTRGLVSDVEPELRSGLPVSAQVPGLFLEDPLYLAFCAAIDELLVPALVAVDCFGAYLDPELAPEDFLPWLAGLVGSVAESQAITRAVATHADRGTPRGLRLSVAACADVAVSAVTIVESGGVTWSARPHDPQTAQADTTPSTDALVIRVVVDAERDRERLVSELRSAIVQEIPAHCSFDVEVSQ